MDIKTELILFSREFPIYKVFDEIGINDGEINILDNATYSTLSGENFVREKEMSISYLKTSNEYNGVEKASLELVDMFETKKNIVLRNIQKYDLSVMFCITISMSDDVEIVLPKELIAFAALLGASIEFDMYSNNERTIVYDETEPES